MQVKLVVVSGRPQGKSLLFPAGAYMFGRGSECHVRPNSELVSRQHCQLVVAPDKASLRDLGSRNGTLVNGEAVTGERDLAEGDQLQVGPLVFKIHLQTAEAVETVETIQKMATDEMQALKPDPSDPEAPATAPTAAMEKLQPK
ncbi:MAG: FHA domain-containing protein [Gemmataceae bacterium]